MTDLEYAVKHSRYDGYGRGKFPDVIPLDFGMDFKLETKPEYYPKISTYHKSGKRTVTLELDSYAGYCAGAIHWYGKLKADGIDIAEDTIDERTGKPHTTIHGGYICEEYKNMETNAFYNSRYDFEILRELTQEDIDSDPHRWEFYRPGDMVNAFYTPKEVIEVAKKVVSARFPDWNFEIKEY